MAYFENMVKSFEASEYANDIPCSAIQILTKALAYQNMSMTMYDLYVESKSDDDWKAVCENDQRSKGLLDAYMIITNREVLNIRQAIFEEIVFVATTYDLDDFIPNRDIWPYQQL